MQNPTFALLTLLMWIALGSSCASTPADYGDSAPEADRWIDVMEDVIGPVYGDFLVPEAERTDGAMDLAAITVRATRAAGYMALGYGVHEYKTVPRFGDYARDCEAWFLEIADEALAGNAERVRELIRDGEIEHCDRCHAAAG